VTTFIGFAKEDGGIELTDYQRATMRQKIKENRGKRIRLTIDLMTPESRNQRKFYHGAILPLIAYYQEGMDHRNHEHLETLHDWLKIEFNGEFINLGGISHKVPKTTKGDLNKYLNRIMEWMDEQGYKTELLNPEDYKKWGNEVFPFGGPDTYIDYLMSLNKL